MERISVDEWKESSIYFLLILTSGVFGMRDSNGEDACDPPLLGDVRDFSTGNMVGK